MFFLGLFMVLSDFLLFHYYCYYYYYYFSILNQNGTFLGYMPPKGTWFQRLVHYGIGALTHSPMMPDDVGTNACKLFVCYVMLLI